MRKLTAKPPKPPTLNLTRIDIRLQQLDVNGWWRELTKLHLLSVLHGLGLHIDNPNIPTIRGGGKTAIGQIGVPTVQFVEPRDEDFRLSRDRLPALIVNIVGASDGVIVDAVKRELKKARKRFPAPVVKPGRAAPNARFDEFTFKKWRRAKIVALAYLLAWRASLSEQDAKHYPDHVLGKLLGLNEPKDTSDAKKTLKEALKNLPALAAQVEQDVLVDCMEHRG
jgi:hypothetical protein